MLNRLDTLFKKLPLRSKITTGYLLSIGLAALGVAAGLVGGKYWLEAPAVERQNVQFQTLRTLSELESAVLETKLSLLPYVQDSSLLADYAYHLTSQASQLRVLVDQAAETASLPEICRTAATAYSQRLEQMLRPTTAAQPLPQSDLLDLMKSSNVLQLDQCALDLQQLVIEAEKSLIGATRALEQARQLENRIAYISILASVTVAIALALYTSQQIAQPIRQASQIAQTVSEEDAFGLRVPITHQDEIGVLARAFNQLLERVQALLTEQQRDQKQLEQYSHHLEATVESRTLELTEKNESLQITLQNLQQAQAQLIQAEKMSGLGQMVAGVAHEINNPVNFIHGNLGHAQHYVEDLLALVDGYQQQYPAPLDLLKEQLEDTDLDFLREDARKLFQSMRTGTQRIREIVLSLRNFPRLDESELKPVNLHEGIESTLMILRHRLKPKRSGNKLCNQAIEIIRDYGDLPLVSCYASQLNQVFMNILANAIDAVEQRAQASDASAPPQITIATSAAAGGVTIAIADNGSGIPTDIQTRLFEPFFTTKPVGKGTGLGLSISYQIVTEHHGGQLLYKPHPAGGSEFQIWLPLRLSTGKQPGVKTES
ncbi:MAG: ATP-binding protein [Cyanobacteria bacterium J06626_23]